MKLYIVGFGSGNFEGMTIEAQRILQACDTIIGYTVYTAIVKSWFPEKEFCSTGMKQEKERVLLALKTASEGKAAALVCSGDSEVYGMAGLALELQHLYPDVEIQVVAGITAALSGGAVLGAPLTHDFAVISLSDLLTPWEKIAARLHHAAMADFTIVLYNPSSRNRSGYLAKACEILLACKSGNTVCGYVRNIGRDEEESGILTLSELKEKTVDMFTTVFIGNSETRNINGKLVTPRGYQNV